MPVPGSLDDFFRITVLRFPSQYLFTFGTGSNQHRRIPCPPGFFLNLKINSRNLFGFFNNLPYAETGFAAQIEHGAFSAVHQILHGQHMGVRQVQYMNVVAQASAD